MASYLDEPAFLEDNRGSTLTCTTMDELPAERLLRQLRGTKSAPRFSQYNGIEWRCNRRRWLVCVQRNHKRWTKYCNSEEEAAHIYDVAVTILYKGIPRKRRPPHCPYPSKLNFPQGDFGGICPAQVEFWLRERGLV